MARVIATNLDIDLKQLRPHARYYLDGGDIYFIAENQSFKVHRYFFERESQVFRDQIKHHRGENESAAILVDVPALDFEKLLGVFYNPKYTVYVWNVEDWIAILRLSEKWKFAEVKDLAIRELEKHAIHISKRIKLYEQYNVDNRYLLPLYATLCRRVDSLTDEESEEIGLTTTVLVFRARERLRALPCDGDGRNSLPYDFDDGEVHKTIVTLLNRGGMSEPQATTVTNGVSVIRNVSGKKGKSGGSASK